MIVVNNGQQVRIKTIGLQGVAGSGTSNSSIVQSAKTQIGNGVAAVTVSFATVGTVSWHFAYIYIRNTDDGSPLVFPPPTLTTRSATGFTVTLSGATDSANYYLEWGISLD